MRGIAGGGWLTLVVLTIVSVFGFSQAGQQNGTLIVSGHPGQAPVTQLAGRPYVAIDALARLMNGSLGYRGNEIILTLPEGTNSAGAAASQTASRAFSSGFLNAVIETTSDIREWRSALMVGVNNGVQDINAQMNPYQARATRNLHLASVAATTDSDRDAFELLKKELNHMQALNDKVVAARKSASYITTDTLKNDPLDQKVLKCARSLSEMAASGEFQDDGSCR